MTESSPHDRPVLAVAGLAFGLTGALSYTLQRLYAAYTTTADFGANVATAHIPYYWRCDLALIHGILAATLVFFAVREAQARALLGKGSTLAAAVAIPCILLMLAVP